RGLRPARRHRLRRGGRDGAAPLARALRRRDSVPARGVRRFHGAGPGGVMPTALADQLVGMGGQVVITRTTTSAGGMQQVYFLSPGMPARRLEGLPASASPDDVRQALLAAIAQRARWRYRVLHRAMGAFDLYVVASREPYLVALGALAAAAA